MVYFFPIRDGLTAENPELSIIEPLNRDFRVRDVRYSQADISKAKTKLGFELTHTIYQGLNEALDWNKSC